MILISVHFSCILISVQNYHLHFQLHSHFHLICFFQNQNHHLPSFAFVFVFGLFGFFYFISPEFSYRPGLSVLSEDSNNAVPSHGAGGPPNRPLPPTPDDDDHQGDRTLIMKRVSWEASYYAQMKFTGDLLFFV